MNTPGLRVIGVDFQPIAQFAKTRSIFCRVQKFKGLHMTYQAPVCQTFDDRVSGPPFAGFLKCKDAFVAGSIGG